ncbi:MAG: outer membrane protein assembly factor BamA [Thermodesulfobacteriota bacterium]
MAQAQVQTPEPELTFKKVAVFPFTVLSKTPKEFLGERLRQEFADRLKVEGFTVVPQEEIARELAALREPLNETLAKEIGRKLGADVVVLGEVVIVREAVSVEARILDLTGRQAPIQLKLQGTGEAALSGLTRQLAGETGLRILGKERIQKITVKGNRRIEADAIMTQMQTREGEQVSPLRLREDLKAIYRMGYFTDVKFDISEIPEGQVLTVIVAEKPAIRDINIRGNTKVKDKTLLDAMGIKTLSVASESVIKEAIEKGLRIYREKGYYETDITYELLPISPQEVNLVFNVDEGGPVYVKDISFEGVQAFKPSTLKGLMETREKSWVPFISRFTGAGRLVRDTLEQDTEKIGAYYFNHGYIKTRIGEPKVDIRQGRVYITIPVNEGPQYRVGKVDLQGDLLEDKEVLREKLDIVDENIYSREVIQKDITTLSDFYADRGYANTDVTPLLNENEANRTVDITFDINKGQKVYFERIEITGNIKTRDKVVRRELRVYEQELFSATKLKESMRNLRRLEYFEDVNFSTTPGSAPDRMNLKVTIKERPTGSFGVGVGYSTQDRLVGMVEVSQNNLFGRGQRLQVQALVGSIASRYRISFLEPYFMDRPLGLGIDAYNWSRVFDEYTHTSFGGSVRLSHPLRWKYTHLFWSYRFENVNLTDLTFSALNTPAIAEARDIHNTSAMTIGVRRDSRDSLFLPTKGSDQSISIEWAGLGGDVAFIRYIVDAAFYKSLKWGMVGVIHGRAGYIQALDYGKQPAYELFYLGGIDSIRGFKYAEITPRDPVTLDRVGGDRFFQINTECRFPFPLLNKYGIVGLVFFDAGNVYGASGTLVPNVRTSAGGGVRWFSPMGPLRVEWGYNLNKKDFERQSAWEFSVGGAF